MDTGDFCDQSLQVPVLTTPRAALDYNMCHKERGLCLILETENFSNRAPATRNLSRRYGSHVDAELLHRAFGTVGGFQILYQKDQTVMQTQLILKQVAAMDHSDVDCFVCVVLTHGDHGELYAHDGKYTVDLLFRNFLGDACPTLVGKPKLFFIQACQGNRLDDGVLVRQSRDSIDSVSYFKIPSYADFMIAYSTLPGFYSFRNTEKGSWFIRALCEVIEEYHTELDILSMMTIVSQKVAYDYTSLAATADLSQKKQCPCITSMLTRRVYIQPKEMEI